MNSIKDGNDAERSRGFTQRVLIVVTIVFAVLLLLWFTGAAFKVLLFVLSAVLFAGFFRKIASWICSRTPLSMGWCLAISTLGVLMVIIAINMLLVPRVASEADVLAQKLPSAVDNAKQYLETTWLGSQLTNKMPENPQQFLTENSGFMTKSFGLVSSTFGVLADVYIVFIIGLFFMINPSPYVNGLVSLVPAAVQQRSREIIYEVYTILQRWLMGKLLSMLVVAILTAIGLFALGMPLVLFLSIFAGLLAFIPNFGPIIALIPALLVALIQSPTTALYVLLLYIVVQVVESNFITPFIQREMVYLPLALIVIAQVVLGILVGGLGLILATPIVAIVMVLIRMIYIEDVLGQEVVDGN